jgi:hypothetical protein
MFGPPETKVPALGTFVLFLGPPRVNVDDVATDVLLTAAETAARLGIRPRTLAVWRQRGIGPAYVRCNSAIRYRKAAIEAYLRKQTVPEGRAPKPALFPVRRWELEP